MAADWLTRRDFRAIAPRTVKTALCEHVWRKPKGMGQVERADCMTRLEAFQSFTDFLDTVVVFLVKNEPDRQAFTPASELIAREHKLERLRAGWDGERDVVLQNMLERYGDGYLLLPSA